MNKYISVMRSIAKIAGIGGVVALVGVAYTASAQSDDLKNAIYAQIAADPGASEVSTEELRTIVDSLTTEAQKANIQVDDIQTAGTFAPLAPQEGGPVNCFDYYSFGSVRIQFEPQMPSVTAGSALSFSGVITNTNSYPLVDGRLYAKVFRLEEGKKGLDGATLVDTYVLQDGIQLAAQGSLPVSFSWQVPQYAHSGEYQIATFFVTSERFNISGLSFTDDVVGDSAHFTVVNGVSEGILFDRNAVNVNGKSVRSGVTYVGHDAPVSVNVYIENTTAEDITVPITWRVYAWDAQRSENLLDTQDSTVTIKAGSRAPASFTVRDSAHAVYMIEGVAQWHDAASFVTTRVVREETDALRIVFPAITAFPLQEGVPATLFACLTNTRESQGRIDLELFDESGALIESYSYDGDVGSDLVGVAKQFTPQQSYDRFTLVARLYHGGEMIDSVTIPYDCTSLDPLVCRESTAGVLGLGTLGGIGSMAAALILAILLMIGAIWVWVRHEKHMPAISTTE